MKGLKTIEKMKMPESIKLKKGKNRLIKIMEFASKMKLCNHDGCNAPKPKSTKPKKTVIPTPEPIITKKATTNVNETSKAVENKAKAENSTSNTYSGSTKQVIKSTDEEVISLQNKIAQDATVCYGAEGLLGSICESGMNTLKSNPMTCMNPGEEWLAALCARESKNPSVQAMAGSMMQSMNTQILQH